MKRALSLTLALILIIGLFSGIDLSVEAASYSYNKGKREEVCTALSSAARNYYTGSYTYSQLSTLSGSNLRTKLRTLVTSNRRTVGYDGLKTYFPYTDAYYANSSKLVLFYCNGTTNGKWDSAKTWNREHMWPDSKGGSAMEGDLHAMRPTDPNTNSTRGNSKYGNVTGGKTAYTNEANGRLPGGTYVSGTYEPYDFAKGDCARTILYDYVVSNSMSSVGIVFTDENTLLEWCALDPVDAYEMSRNDVAQEIQGCRNPFVDYPELAWILLGKQIPAGLITPTMGSTPSYTITASTNNSAYGTVKVQGNVILATPAEGCYVEGYTLLSGNATVTRDGNQFVVDATSNCSIRINFAKKTTVTVGFHNKATAITAYAGEAITLPNGADEAGYTFVGWVEDSVAKTATRPTYYKAGEQYVPTRNIDLYALYSITEGGMGGNGMWTLVEEEEDLVNGLQVVIAYNEKGKVAGDISTTFMAAVDATFSDDFYYIENLPEGASVLTLGGEDGFRTLTDQQGRPLGCSKAKSLGWNAGTITWDIRITDEGADIFSTISTYGRILYNVSAPRFTTYTGNPATHLPRPQLYMLNGTAGTTYYTTEITQCEHSYEAAVTAPTCTEDGFTTYTCRLCGNSYVADTVAATGHSYESVITAPTCTEEGFTTYTCGVCGDSYKADTVEALGHSYEGVVTAPTCTEEGFTTYTCKVCGDSYVGDTVEAMGHAWDEGTVTLEPTETEDGEKTYTCTRCEETKVESIPAMGEGESQDCQYGDGCGSKVFVDMPGVEQWSHAGIDFAVSHGLFNGMSETTFAPDKTMTRAMLVTVLWRSAGEPEAQEAEFTDVATGKWYAQAVAWAAEQGVVTGYSDGTFRPDNQITREQLATILFRYAKLTEMDPPERAELSIFPDAENVQSYAVEAMQWAVAKGLVNGVYNKHEDQTYLLPGGSATRAQVATILMRFLQEDSEA